MEDLIPSFRDTVLSPLSEPAKELLETGIDAVLESGALRAIPIVNLVSSVCKVGINLHERNLLKQTAEFINGFNAGTIDEERLENHKRELEEDPQKAEKELGRVMIILAKQIDGVQSKVLGSFYNAYVIKHAISWDKFCELSEANSRMFSNDYSLLIDAATHGGIDFEGKALYQVDRLISLGLLSEEHRIGQPKWDIIDEEIDLSKNANEKDVLLTSFGKTFVQHMPKL